MVGKKQAIVHNRPGVTRDWREEDAELGGYEFRVIDTAGLETEKEASKKGELSANMLKSTQAAINLADVVLFIVDAAAGVLPYDDLFAKMLRESGKPAFLLANKTDIKKSAANLPEMTKLGFGEPIAISAAHNGGISLILEAISPYYDDFCNKSGLAELAMEGENDDHNDIINIAIVGRPNAGKSTLINHLLGYERMITGAEAGITRDAVTIPLEWQGQGFNLVDTAGIRKRAKIIDDVEKLAAGDSHKAIRFCHVAVLMIDATIPLEKQDINIARHIAEEGRGLVIALNKWDLIDKDKHILLEDVERYVMKTIAQIREPFIVPISARDGVGMNKLLNMCEQVYNIWNKHIATADLNRWLEDAIAMHPPPLERGRHIRIRYVNQPKTRPPSFMFSCSQPDKLPESYLRYLASSLHENFGFRSVPIRVIMRKKHNPYVRD